MIDAVVVYCSFPDADAAASAGRQIVEEKLAACVNVVAPVRSIYRWGGEICDDAEALAVFKTLRARFEALRARLVELHSYDCPEVIATSISAGHAPYLEWLEGSCEP